jgi:serine/threonine-protein kinase
MLSPAAAACAMLRANVFSVRGQCDALEREARRMVAAEPNGDWSYYYLVEALGARRAPVEVLQEAVAAENSVADDRAGLEWDLGRVARYKGDLGAAIAHANAAERMWREKDPSNRSWRAMMLYEEIGDRPRAAALAEEYLRRSVGSGPAGALGFRGSALAVLRLAGRIRDEEFRRERDQWAAQAHAVARPWDDAGWVYVYGASSVTPQDAREAVEALPRFPALPRRIGQIGEPTALEEAVGRTYLLAGALDEAIPHLRAAAGSCGVINWFPEHVHAHEELGEALAAKGDTPAACDEFRAVLSYWGDAKPRSVTADKARAQMRRLGCPK